MNPRRRLGAAALAVGVAAFAAGACGKKGPPLPPLVLLPTPPGDFSAVRRGPEVALGFRVPNANTDRSTPADLTHVDVYALTASTPVAAEDVLRRGVRVATVAVNKPRDPDEPEPRTPAAKGPGLEQNEVAALTEPLPPDADPSGYRSYVAVGVNARGRRGALSPRLAMPLVAPPSPPPQPRATYDETTISLAWAPVAAQGGEAYTYAVYRPGVAVPLTPSPVRDPLFLDKAIEWEKERCYEVRTVAVVEAMRIESAPSPGFCLTVHDTFAPAAPRGLVGVGSEGSISLIWTANSEADLAGYLVLRAIEPATTLTPVTPAPITDTNFRDALPAGGRATYAVQAVDRAGNHSEPSNRIAETAR
ncbi:MAG TPA: hypothetical protein VM032_06565 [Vicinamibacterales bacterium]|nr:hypothetical protein [Vicinamibacterales bacterium]